MSTVQSRGFDFLTESLFTNNTPVTYKTLSRSLNLHNVEAKRILEAFYNTFNDKHKELSKSYIIIGEPKLQVSTASIYVKVLDKVNTEEELKKQIDQIFTDVKSCSVYSLSPNAALTNEEIINLNIQSSSNAELTKENLKNWGVIRAADESIDISSLPSRSSLQEKPLAAPEPKLEQPVSRSKTEPTPNTSSNSSGSSSLNSGSGLRYVSRKSQTQTPETKSTFSYTSRKSEVKKPAKTSNPTKEKKNVKVEQPEEDVSGPSTTKVISAKDRKLAEEQSIKLQGLFDGDDIETPFSEDDNAESNMDVDSVEPEETVEAAEPEQVEIGDLMKKPVKAKKEKKATEPHPEPAPEPEMESYYDEEGYLVTRVKAAPKFKLKPEADTSEPKKHKIELPPQNSSGPAPKKKKTGQTSLMNFFGSKKK